MHSIKEILFSTIRHCSIQSLNRLLNADSSLEPLILQYISKEELNDGIFKDTSRSSIEILQKRLLDIYKSNFGESIPPLKTPVLVSYLIKEHVFDVLDRYEVQYTKPLGEGSYGTICNAWDKEEKTMVAIKKNRNVFSFDAWYQKRIYRELRILRHLDHENIINLIDLIPPKSYEEFTDVYLVTEKMETDLRRIIDSDQEITEEHIQYFLHQMLSGLMYIHSANILHRDLKPENILINSDCSVKICDFGLSRSFDFENDNPVMSTPYVATRWYRAPELLLQSRNADRGIDIWSVGCIFAELLLRKPFFPGKNYLDQLNLIIKVLGTPNISNIPCDISAQQYMDTLPYIHPKSFKEIFKNASDNAIDLLEKMLQFDPSKRITLEQALQHPYLKDLGNGTNLNDNICPEPFDFGNENIDADIKGFIYEEIMEWNAVENGFGGDSVKFPSCPRLQCYRLHNFHPQAHIFLPLRYYLPIHMSTDSIKFVYRKENGHLLLVGVDNVYERPVLIRYYLNGALWEDKCKKIALTILILQHIGEHNNILSLVDIAPPISYEQFKDTIMITEYLEFTLQTLLKSNYYFKDNTILVIIYQICLGILYTHSANISHCNLCPSCIYIDKNLNVKIGGYGNPYKESDYFEEIFKNQCQDSTHNSDSMTDQFQDTNEIINSSINNYIQYSSPIDSPMIISSGSSTTQDSNHYKNISHQLFSNLSLINTNDYPSKDQSSYNINQSMKQYDIYNFQDSGVPFFDTLFNNEFNTSTHFYKAPELLMEYAENDEPSDVWSIGCMLAQLYNNNMPLFSGSSMEKMIESQIKILGPPKPEDIPSTASQEIIQFINSIQDLPIKNSLSTIFSGISECARDLIMSILVWNPNERPTIEEVLQHEYFSKFYHLKKTVHKSQIIKKFPVTTSYRDLLYKLIISYAQHTNAYLGDAIVENGIFDLPHVEDL